MKATKLTSLLVIALALTIAGTGCRKRPTDITPINKRDTIVRADDSISGLPSYNPGDDISGTDLGTPMNPADWLTHPDGHTADASVLAAYTVHFEFDSSVVKSSERGNVEAVANYLKSNPGVGLR